MAAVMAHHTLKRPPALAALAGSLAAHVVAGVFLSAALGERAPAMHEFQVTLIEARSSPRPAPARVAATPRQPASGPAAELPPAPAAADATPMQQTEPTNEASAPVTAAYTAPVYRAAYLHNPLPHYPRAARLRGLEGRVLLGVEVSPLGECRHVEVIESSGHALLDRAALEAVRRWRFIPARRGGEPIAARLEVPIIFRLEG